MRTGPHCATRRSPGPAVAPSRRSGIQQHPPARELRQPACAREHANVDPTAHQKRAQTEHAAPGATRSVRDDHVARHHGAASDADPDSFAIVLKTGHGPSELHRGARGLGRTQKKRIELSTGGRCNERLAPAHDEREVRAKRYLDRVETQVLDGRLLSVQQPESLIRQTGAAWFEPREGGLLQDGDGEPEFGGAGPAPTTMTSNDSLTTELPRRVQERGPAGPELGGALLRRYSKVTSPNVPGS